MKQLSFSPPIVSPGMKRSQSPFSCTIASSTPLPVQTMVATVAEQLESDYCVHELPTVDVEPERSCSATIPAPLDSTGMVVNAALIARIEVLESQNRAVTDKLQVAIDQQRLFKLSDIAG